jgi:hypothetical protein
MFGVDKWKEPVKIIRHKRKYRAYTKEWCGFNSTLN